MLVNCAVLNTLSGISGIPYRATMFKLGNKNYLFYVAWLRMCQLLTVLKKVPRTLIGLVGTSHLMRHQIVSIMTISDFL